MVGVVAALLDSFFFCCRETWLQVKLGPVFINMSSIDRQESGNSDADLANDGHPQKSSSCASTSLDGRTLESTLVQVSSCSPEEVEEIKSQLSKLTVRHLKEIGRLFHAVLGKRKCDIVQNLLDLGLLGKLSAALLTEDDPAKPLLALEIHSPICCCQWKSGYCVVKRMESQFGQF